MPDITHDDEAIRALLSGDPSIAVVGASADSTRTSNAIFGYLQRAGYTPIPVTPKPSPVNGVEPVGAIPAGVDIVDVFRNRDATPEVARAAVDAGAKAIWFQLATDHPDAVQIALDGGLQVVADRCIKVEHMRLGL